MWVFCKNRCVKQKKQLFSCKIDDKFTRAGVDALRALTLCMMWSNDKFKQVRDFEWDGGPLVKFVLTSKNFLVE